MSIIFVSIYLFIQKIVFFSIFLWFIVCWIVWWLFFNSRSFLCIKHKNFFRKYLKFWIPFNFFSQFHLFLFEKKSFWIFFSFFSITCGIFLKNFNIFYDSIGDFWNEHISCIGILGMSDNFFFGGVTLNDDMEIYSMKKCSFVQMSHFIFLLNFYELCESQLHVICMRWCI